MLPSVEKDTTRYVHPQWYIFGAFQYSGQYRGRLFKYAEPAGWRIIVTNPQHIEEIARAPDDVLSLAESVNDVGSLSWSISFSPFSWYVQMTQIVYTMGPEIHHRQWHNALIRGQLTRNINRFFPEMHDELVTALSEGICVEDSCRSYSPRADSSD